MRMVWPQASSTVTGDTQVPKGAVCFIQRAPHWALQAPDCHWRRPPKLIGQRKRGEPAALPRTGPFANPAAKPPDGHAPKVIPSLRYISLMSRRIRASSGERSPLRVFITIGDTALVSLSGG